MCMFNKRVSDKDIDLAVGNITKDIAHLDALADRAERESDEMMKESVRLQKLAVEQTLVGNRADGIAAKLRNLIS